MKKSILYSFITLLVTFLLSGCGSNAIKDDGENSSSQKNMELQAAPVSTSTNGKEFNINVKAVKKLPTPYMITLKNFELVRVDGCSIGSVNVPSELTMSGGEGSYINIPFSGTFIDTCNPSGYEIKFSQTISDGTRSKTETVTFDTTGSSSGSLSGGQSTQTPVNGFFNATTPMTISKANTPYIIQVQVLEDGYAVSGKTVKAKAFDSRYGMINNPTTQTGENGYAVFDYISPQTIPDGESATIELTNEENGTVISQKIVLNFDIVDNNGSTPDVNVTLPNVVIPSDLRDITLDSNSKTVEIPIRVFKDIAPYTKGSVKVELPKKVLNGADVGQFTAYEVPVNAQGIATFNYTGPSNMEALIASGDTESIFQFYHVENSTDKQAVRMHYEVPANPHLSRNYALKVVTSGEFSMGIPDKEKTFNVLLKAKDSAGNDVALSSEQITKITAETTNSTIAQLLDTNSNTLVDSLDLNPTNNSSFVIKSKQLSGLVPVKVAVEFKDANGDPQKLMTIINVRVYSGPPTAISISYIGTTQDVDRAKYIEKLAISVTDEYGNRVNTRPNISLGAIVGYAVDGSEASPIETNETKRLFYGRDDIENGIANGAISNPDSVHKATFSDLVLPDVFRYVNQEGSNTDKLVIFGERKNYEAMGKWDIEKSSAPNTLSLTDDYYGISRSGLYYAVGHNYYQDQCRQDGREWLGTTDSDTYQLDEEGTVTVEYKYDYHLTGKDALIWVNLDGLQPDTGKKTRIGEVSKHTLRGYGLTKVPSNGYQLAKGASGYGTFIIWHENAPERYRNAHFSYAIKSGSTCAYSVVATSNPFDARTCDNRVTINNNNDTFGTTDGTAYVTFFLQAPPDKECTFDLERIIVSSEF